MFKDKISKFLIVSILCFLLIVPATSCAFLRDTFDGTVVTTEDNIKEESRKDVATIPLENVNLPKEAKERLLAEGKTPVIARIEDVKDESKAIEISKPGWSNLVDIGVDVAKTMFPGVAIVEGLGVILSRRKRSHYIEAVRNLNPMDGTGQVDVKEAVVSLARALGLAHSSPATKQTFEGVGSEQPKTMNG